MAVEPLTTLDITCTSRAEHFGFVGLSDVATAVGDTDSRVIGGHMVALHALRWRLQLSRATQDVDLGVKPFVARNPDLTDSLVQLGYNKVAGNRFRRQVSNLQTASGDNRSVVDILVPAYTSRPRANRAIGDLVTTEVPGLALAFQRQPVDLLLRVQLLDGSKIEFPVRLPDEVSMLVLKIMARTVRREDRDAVDVWRALEVCATAGIQNADLGADASQARQVIDAEFGRNGKAIKEIATSRNLSADAAQQRETRIQALIARVLRPPD